LSKPQRFLTRPIVTLLAIQLVTGVLVSPQYTFFPIYLQELGFSAVALSLIVALQRLTALFTSIGGGALADGMGAKRVLIVSQLAYFAGTVVFSLSGAWQISLFWAVSGIGLGLNSMSSQSYLLEKASPARLGLMTALLYLGYTIGAAIGNPLVGALLQRAGYARLAPVAVVPAAATLVFTGLALPRSAVAAASVGGWKARLVADVKGYRTVAARPGLTLLGILRFLPTFSYGMLLVFVPLQLKGAGATKELVALYATVNSICASLAQLLVGRIADKAGWRAPLAVVFATFTVSAILVGVLPGNLWVVFVAAVIAMSAAWSLSTLGPMLVSDAVAQGERGRALGFIQLFWCVAMIAGGLIGGSLYELWIGLPMTVGGVVTGSALLLLPTLSRRLRARRAEAR